ncbi:MAG: ECF-type sigma factor [Planctomycetaceae bacterium]
MAPDADFQNAHTGITELLFRVQRSRDEDAVNRLWNVYFRQLARVAKKLLRNSPNAVHDGEDAALSAFHSFIQRAEDGRLTPVANRDELWRLLVTITLRKVQRRYEHAAAKKRRMPDDLSKRIRGSEAHIVEQLRIEMRDLLASLPDDTLHTIAVMQLEGHSISEIAESLGVARTTIDRKLRRIRALWSRQTGDSEDTTP